MSNQDNTFQGKDPKHVVRGMVMSHYAVGNVEADGQSYVYVELGFRPAHLKLFALSNAADDPAGTVEALEWNESMFYENDDGELQWSKAIRSTDSGDLSRVDCETSDPTGSGFGGIYVDARGFYIGQDNFLQGTETHVKLINFVATG